MKVELITSNIEVENYLKNIGIANMKQRKIFSMCNLVKVNGDIKLVHFKEVMQLKEKLFKDEFIDICINGFGGYLENEQPTKFDSNMRFKYINKLTNDYIFNKPVRGLELNVFKEFIERVFTQIDMDIRRGVQTNTYDTLKICINDFICNEEYENNDIFYKKDLIKYIENNYLTDKGYSTVAPLLLDDLTLKARYLNILIENNMINALEYYDSDVPEFKAMFKNKYTQEWVADENSKFLNLNEFDESSDEFERVRKINTPSKYIIWSKR